MCPFNNNSLLLFLLLLFVSSIISIIIYYHNNNNKPVYGKGEITSMFSNNLKYWTSSEEEYNKHTKTTLHRAIIDIYKNSNSNNNNNNNNSLYNNMFGNQESYFNQFKTLLQQEEHIKNIIYADPDDNGNTPLHLAVKYDLLPVIELIINKDNTSVAVIDKLDKTPLMYAFEKDNPDIIKLLTSNSDLLNAYDTEGKTNLYHVISEGDLKLLNTLLKFNNIKINTFQKKNGEYTISILYAYYNISNKRYHGYNTISEKTFFEIFKTICNKPEFNINIELQYYPEFLFNIINMDYRLYNTDKYELNETIKLLYEHPNKLDINKILPFTKDKRIMYQYESVKYTGTVLHMAITANKKYLIEYLLTIPDINVNIKCNDENNIPDDTPLLMAVHNFNKEFIELLLKHPNIDTNIKDKNGLIAFEIAKKNIELMMVFNNIKKN
jgi:ankyrin repeat protein